MTNFSEIKTNSNPPAAARKTSGQPLARLPLIPPASVRTSANQQGQGPLEKKRVAGRPEAARPAAAATTASGSEVQDCEVWNSAEELFWHHMSEVENKWNILKLNDDIWAKLIYFERNRRLAKAYVSAPVLTVDGSTNGLDGFRIGLSGIDNTYRDLNSIGCLRSIGLGIKLKIDTQGNIMIRKVLSRAPEAAAADPQKRPQCSIWIKEWPRAQGSAADLSDFDASCSMRELNLLDKSYSKLFDMRRFRCELERQRALSADRKRRESPSASWGRQVVDWRQCVSIISFVFNTDPAKEQRSRPATSLLRDPCWVMIINIIALDLLKSLSQPGPDSGAALFAGGRLAQPARLPRSPSAMNLFQTVAPAPPNRKLSSTTEQQVAQHSRRPSSRGGLRTSSSAAMLFPASASSCSNSSNYSNNSSSANFQLAERPASVADREPAPARVSRQRLVSPPSRLADYRRFRSSQQLAATNNNSTIYTTFDVNNRNRQPDYNSSTSDYNSVSRSTSSGYGSNWTQQPAGGNYSRYHNNNYAYKRLSRNRLLESAALASNRNYNNNLNFMSSLSNFDLTQQQQQPVRRKQPAGIRINYDDYLSENDDEQLESARVQPNSTPRARQEAKLVCCAPEAAGETCCSCCNITERLKSQLGTNSNKCPAGVLERHEQSKPEVERSGARSNQGEPAKAARSSIGSSSSSSGCPDNDYFLSQSSSSMSSSSAASNELFAESAEAPAATSTSTTKTAAVGAIRNRNAARRYLNGNADDGGTPKNDHRCSHERKEQEATGNNHRRGYNIKQLEPALEFSCGHTNGQGNKIEPMSNSNDKLTSSTTNSDSLMDSAGCDCPTESADLDCNCECCACDCCPPPAANVNNAQMVPEQEELCNCLEDETESIYSRLPHPSATSNSIDQAAGEKTALEQPHQEKTAVKKRSSFLGIRRSGSSAKLNNTQTPTGNEKQKLKSGRSGSKEQLFFKQTGWLDRSKYSRILPKFIFSNSRCEHDQQLADGNTQTARGKLDAKTRSTTLDKNIKYRLTNSSFDLA